MTQQVNRVALRPRQLKAALAAMIPARKPLLIVGSPGIGKTEVVEQATREAGADMIISHPVVSDPTDAKGLPWPDRKAGKATFLPFGELAQALEATKPTVWFLDDLGQASPAVQASFMQLILARRINGHKLSDHVTFVAATNKRTDRAGVQGILEPVKSRFASIVELEVDVEDWAQWAIDHNQPPELLAFIRLRRDLLHQFNPTQDLKNSPCPRTWANAGAITQLRLPQDIELALIQGAVGEGAAAEFVGFMRVWREMPSLDGILMDPKNGKIPKNSAARFAVMTGLASKVTKANFPRIAVYAERVLNEGAGEFAALLINDCFQRDNSIADTNAYISLSAGELGDMLLGK